MLTLRTLVGRLERRLAAWFAIPADAGCTRCHRPNVPLHVTRISIGWSMSAVCEPCWRELTPETRLPFYEPVIRTMSPREQPIARHAVVTEAGVQR